MDKQLNVVFMGNFEYPCGMAETKRIQHFIDYLTGHHVTVKVLLLRQGGSRRSGSQLKGSFNGVCYETIGNNIQADASLLMLSITLPVYFWKGMANLLKWKERNAKNVLYCYNGISLENIFFVLIGRFLGYFIIFDIVEDYAHIQEKMHIFAKTKLSAGLILEKYISRFADAIVVISHYLLQKYEMRVGGQIPVMLIPISAKIRNNPGKKEFGNPVKFAYSGSFAKKDGVELLIEAFSNAHRANENCLLILTGKGSNLQEIQKLITNNNAIKYSGYLEDEQFYNFLQDADVLCVTRTNSKFANAGFPFKLGEYLATGNPVIVSNVSDVSSYLEHMKDAIIVTPDNIKEIQDALVFCMDHSEEAIRIGERGKQKCQKYFNPQINAHKLLELIHVLEKQR